MKQPRIFFVSNTGWYLYNFRLPLAKELRSQGIEITMVCPPDAYVSRLTDAGFHWIEWPLERCSLNPLEEAGRILHLARIFHRERPDVVHHFTIKCVLYGSIAARLVGINAVVNALPGLGQVYTGQGWKTRTLRVFVNALYRALLTHRNTRVIFQNPDDEAEFAAAGLVVRERTRLIRSSGVNIERFQPDLEEAPESQEPPIVFTAARLTHSKGIFELVEAARILKSRGVAVRFQLAGDIDHGNPTAIPEAALHAWREEGIVELLGHVDSVKEYLRKATLVALPSYREGVPRTLTEAAAMGKAIVTTDAPGCREIVEHGVNGLLVPVRDARALADAIEHLLTSPELRQQMGQASRKKAVEEFDEREVIRRTIAVYQEMGIPTNSHIVPAKLTTSGMKSRA